MLLTPGSNPTICAGNGVDMGATVQSYFGNHNSFKWQKSTDNGNTWAETGVSGKGTPVWENNTWEYNIRYPEFIANKTDSGTKYKIIVATTDANLTNNCSFNSNTSSITLNVIDCRPVLATDILSFSGQRVEGKNHLKWTTSKEPETLRYIVERSSDGQFFTEVGTLTGNGVSNDLNRYEWTDVAEDNLFYRIRMINEGNSAKFLRVLRIGNSEQPITGLHIGILLMNISPYG